MVSVILNTINEKPELLKRAIDSYLVQSCELIISTITDDPCISVLEARYGSRVKILEAKYGSRIKIVTMPRAEHPYGHGGKSPRGSFLQLNNALPHITGDWFTFASGNDYSYPFKLETERRMCIAQRKEVCYSAYDYEYEDGSHKSQFFYEYDREKHWHGNFVADCSIISRRLVDKYLPFRTELNNYAYWDLWLRIYKGEGNVFAYNPVPTWAYIQDRSSMHVQRWADPVKMREAEADKNRMLNLHR